MKSGTFELTQVGANKRFVIHVKDEEGALLLKSQYRELKPMCLNEISWIRIAGAKDNLYEFLETEDGSLYFSLHAADAHVLGTSPFYETVVDRDKAVASLKRIAATAEVRDSTPDDDLTTRVHDVLQSYAREVMARA